MAAQKGKKAPLREDIESQEAWDAYLQKDGLKVVDAFTEWCGPCKAVLSLFRRLKTDLGDALLNFATVNTDKVGSLKSYNGRSEPVFLFYAKNVLVNVVRGANGPLLERTIKAELKNEHEVLEKGISRKSVVDVPPPPPPVVEEPAPAEAAAAAASAAPSARASVARAKSSKRDFTLALIKPDAVEKADPIFARIAEAHLHVQTQNEVSLTKEQACAFYAEHRGKPFFDDLISFMTSGHVIPIVLAGTNAVAAWRTLMGPTSTEKARAENPDSLRAQFGTDNTRNAVHGSDSPASASREILFFFPEWAAENLAPETTVLAVRGAALPHAEAIKQSLVELSFTILREADVTLTHGKAEALIAAHSTSGTADDWAQPSHVFELEKIAAIRGIIDLVGPSNFERASQFFPETLHARFSTAASTFDFFNSVGGDTVAADAAVFFGPTEDATRRSTVAEGTAAAAATAAAAEAATSDGAATGEGEHPHAHGYTEHAPAPPPQHRPSVVAKDGLDAPAEAQKLRSAFAEAGCDEAGVVAVLGSIPRAQRLQIVEAYNTQFSRNFVEDAKAELKGDFEMLVTSAVTPLEDFDAAMLHHCLAVLEKSPVELAEFVATRTAEHLAAVRAAFERIYGGNIIEAIKKHSSGLAEALLIGATTRTTDAPADPAAQVKALTEATGSLGNETGALVAAFSAAGPVRIKALADEYAKVAGITIVEAVEKELTGAAVEVVKTLVECGCDPAGHFAAALHAAMDGPGTRDRRLVRVVLSRSEEDMGAIKDAYAAKYGKALAESIKDDTAGPYERMLLKLIGN